MTDDMFSEHLDELIRKAMKRNEATYVTLESGIPVGQPGWIGSIINQAPVLPSTDPLIISKYAAYVPMSEEMLCDAGQCECKVHVVMPTPRAPLRRRMCYRWYNLKARIREAIKALRGTVHDDCD